MSEGTCPSRTQSVAPVGPLSSILLKVVQHKQRYDVPPFGRIARVSEWLAALVYSFENQSLGFNN
jgi:hypothetical protein